MLRWKNVDSVSLSLLLNTEFTAFWWCWWKELHIIGIFLLFNFDWDPTFVWSLFLKCFFLGLILTSIDRSMSCSQLAKHIFHKYFIFHWFYNWVHITFFDFLAVKRFFLWYLRWNFAVTAWIWWDRFHHFNLSVTVGISDWTPSFLLLTHLLVKL